MNKICLFLLVAMFSCTKTEDMNDQIETVVVDTPPKFVIMVITLEDQFAKGMNEDFEKFHMRKRDETIVYVSEVKEVRGEIPEDRKYFMLDSYERKLLNEVRGEYIVMERDFEIYNSYGEASKARQEPK